MGKTVPFATGRVGKPWQSPLLGETLQAWNSKPLWKLRFENCPAPRTVDVRLSPSPHQQCAVGLGIASKFARIPTPKHKESANATEEDSNRHRSAAGHRCGVGRRPSQ